MSDVASCLHCGSDCRLTDGREIYPHRGDLYEKPVWKCDECNATVGCHPDTTIPLGYAANKETRRARSLLHEKMLDPLWKNAPGDDGDKRAARRKVYKYLTAQLGIEHSQCHTGMFDIHQCRAAWWALHGRTLPKIEEWCAAQREGGSS